MSQSLNDVHSRPHNVVKEKKSAHEIAWYARKFVNQASFQQHFRDRLLNGRQLWRWVTRDRYECDLRRIERRGLCFTILPSIVQDRRRSFGIDFYRCIQMYFWVFLQMNPPIVMAVKESKNLENPMGFNGEAKPNVMNSCQNSQRSDGCLEERKRERERPKKDWSTSL